MDKRDTWAVSKEVAFSNSGLLGNSVLFQSFQKDGVCCWIQTYTIPKTAHGESRAMTCIAEHHDKTNYTKKGISMECNK